MAADPFDNRFPVEISSPLASSLLLLLILAKQELVLGACPHLSLENLAQLCASF